MGWDAHRISTSDAFYLYLLLFFIKPYASSPMQGLFRDYTHV